jgi:hypothetical protein
MLSNKPTIKFTISAAGDVTLDVLNTKGTQCVELSKPFEIELGIVTERDPKDTFYEEATTESTTLYENH